MHYGWPSPYMPVLENGKYTFSVTSEEGSWLTVIPLIGAMVGALATGMIVDIFGRKRLIVLSSLPFFASWLMVALASSSTLMFIGRFIAGLSDGLSFTAVPMYLGEISESKIRGLLASICPVSVIFGVLLINVLGEHLSLQTSAYIGAVIPVVLLITYSWMPESPYFHVMKGETEEARKSLEIFRGTKDVDEELKRISEAVRQQNEVKGSILDLFTVRSNRKGLLITLGLRGFQQLSGTTAIIFYCKTIFEESKDFISAGTATIIYFSVQLVLSALSSVIVDFAGRRPLLIISTTGTAITLLIQGVFLYFKICTDVDMSRYHFVPIVALLSFVIVFSVGLQTIPLLMMGEIFPTDVKAIALSLMDLYYSLIVTIISQFFHWTKEVYGLHVPFFTFFGCCLVGLLFIIFFVPETKGKTLEDIQAELKGVAKVVDTKKLSRVEYY
ncbi:unnamed protein product [Acanthoscelides obtectus]|nr:unnamed protein product [Acanthoscelides obtectus]CAK1655489.1 Facilitated trehalose transporter Tret1 [Acanthoscelides obtectus]